MILYLIRHAQSLPKASQPFSDWALSPVGLRQAQELACLLEPLHITRLFSSPYVRSLQTARPFARNCSLPIVVMDGLRERFVVSGGGPPSEEVWRKSWEDFSFAPPGCETSAMAQTRICQVIHDIALNAEGTAGIFTHGNVISLFLNALTSAFGRKEAERLTNPDVLKIKWKNGVFAWDSDYRLPGLDRIATEHNQTPVEQK